MKKEPWGWRELLSTSQVFSGVTQRDVEFDTYLQSVPLSSSKTVIMTQTHSANVQRVEGCQENITTLDNCDGIYTTQTNYHLAVKTADCLPILIYHPHPLIAVIHAGRKGTEQHIVQAMCRLIDENEEVDLSLADFYFGPCICKSCYQIDRDTDLHMDLIAENTAQLKEVVGENVQISQSPWCTACHNDLFYSYRKEGPRSGRIWSSLCLIP